ncbi:M20/M25/M40 family metallo-hydrolase [Defluviimonas sp. SAOS-178_SWC]|uniref:M20/M25/M40 family metallo-hydrolase n=1 Tax=Defluviimonas sp. SAOS-178_SWC TaxID=3121287 RepID=UPI00322211CF
MHVACLARDVERLAVVVALDDRDHLRRHPARLEQPSDPLTALKAEKDEAMTALVARAEQAVAQASARSRLKHAVTYHDVFHHCENDPDAARRLEDALQAEGVPRAIAELPMRRSEDFGRFRSHSKSAMFLLGSGTGSPSLHNPDFDFPDELIAVGARVFVRALRPLCYDLA